MKQFLSYTLLIALVMSQAACEKKLNAPPSQAVVENTLVVDQSSAEIALNGAYYRFAGVTTVLAATSTRWYSHEVHPAMMAGMMQYGFGAMNFQTNNFTPASTGDWTLAYNILNAANGAIKGVESLADSKFIGNRKKEILAEAKFLRAYAHFFLLSYFAEWYKLESPYGVMLRKQPLQLSTGTEPRSSVKDSYDYILQDVNEAILNCPDSRPVYYANKVAAKALKMRVLTARAQPTDYAAIIALADEIMGNTKYQLEPNLKDLFQVKGIASTEVLLGITPFASQQGQKSIFEYVQSSVYLATKAYRDLFQNDPRSTWMYRKVTTSPTTALSVDSFYISKFAGAKYEDIYAFRLTEVYLLKAEAIARSGGSLTDAKTLLKTVMAKAGVTDFTAVDNAATKDDVIYQIYLEFSRNMTAEDGIEWMALLRLPFEKVKQIRPSITGQFQYIFPIPATEFQLNSSIGEQNPGYPKQ
jgi:hypothetical protein